MAAKNFYTAQNSGNIFNNPLVPGVTGSASGQQQQYGLVGYSGSFQPPYSSNNFPQRSPYGEGPLNVQYGGQNNEGRKNNEYSLGLTGNQSFQAMDAQNKFPNRINNFTGQDRGINEGLNRNQGYRSPPKDFKKMGDQKDFSQFNDQQNLNRLGAGRGDATQNYLMGRSMGSNMPFNRGVSRGGSRPMRQNPPVEMHYCEVCRVSCAGTQTYMEHLEGKNHKKREMQSKRIATTLDHSEAQDGVINPMAPANVRQYYCKLCDTLCTGLDTYKSHCRGTRHIKVLNLFNQMDKPIPPILDPDQIKTESKEGQNGNNNAEDKDVAEEVQPIGLEYIEESSEGNFTSYYCKLCKCNFSDPHARNAHAKGRRHRLNYKQEVDPSLVVDKPLSEQRYRRKHRDKDWQRDLNYNRRQVETLRMEKEMLEWRLHQQQNPHQQQDAWDVYNMGTLFSALPQAPVRPDRDDRHIIARHEEIFPTEPEMEAVKKVVTDCEQSLKAVSDLFAEKEKELKDKKVQPTVNEASGEETPSADGTLADDERHLKGVMRVGVLAKGLLLRGLLHVELVVLCSKKPTKGLVKEMAAEMAKNIKTDDNDYSVKLSDKGTCMEVINKLHPGVICTVYVTSSAVKDAGEDDGAANLLDKQKCLQSLAKVRHTRWFQTQARPRQHCCILIRIFKDIAKRNPQWSSISDWIIELVVERCLSSGIMLPVYKNSLGSGFKRVLEFIASGMVLPGGCGLIDPCEKGSGDVLALLPGQKLEEWTKSAQHMLRQVTFGHIYKVLGLENSLVKPFKHGKKEAAEEKTI